MPPNPARAKSDEWGHQITLHSISSQKGGTAILRMSKVLVKSIGNNTASTRVPICIFLSHSGFVQQLYLFLDLKTCNRPFRIEMKL